MGYPSNMKQTGTDAMANAADLEWAWPGQNAAEKYRDIDANTTLRPHLAPCLH